MSDRESEQRYRRLVEGTTEGVWIIDRDDRTSMVNSQLERMLGCEPGEMLGMPVGAFVSAEALARLPTDMTRRRLGIAERIEVKLRKKDGGELWASLHTNTLFDEAGQYEGSIALVADITESRRAAEALVERAQIAALTAEVALALGEAAELGHILQRCAAALVANLGAAFARVWTFNAEEQVLELRASAGLYTHIDGAHARVRLGTLKIGLIAEERLPHLTNDVLGDPRVGDPEWARREGMVAFAGHPLVVAGELVGVMAVFARKPLTETAASALAATADLLAVGIRRKLAEAAKERLEAQLDQARTREEERLRFAYELSRAELESSPDGILVVGADRRIVSFNKRFRELWQVRDDSLTTGDDQRLRAWVLDQLKDPASVQARLEELYARAGERSHEEIELKDGRIFERHSGPLPVAAGEDPGRIFFFRDISARKRAEAHVARMARQDGLTGLANRTVFVESIQQSIARTRRGSKGFALLYLDLDHFKDINDTLGHPAGDELLREVAHRLKASVRAIDLVARFGGDEFAVLQSDVTDATEAAALAQRLLGAMRDPVPIHGNEIRIGVSIGIAIHSPEVDAETLLSQADLALYRAKFDGRGTFRFFAEGMDSDVRARVALVSDLRRGIEAGELFLVYQPQVSVATRRIVGLEALVRWRNPRRGVVGPGDFIPVAEKSGLIVPLGRWVMREACRQAKVWADAGVGPAVISVNVSGSQFRTPGELQTVLETVLAETGLPPQQLEIELTETVLMEAWFEQRETLLRIRNSGVGIAIDDFGTGFSSLQYLSRYPVDRIKIAQDFVSDLGKERSSNAAIVKATIGLARELGLQVIAEGVETAEQVALLTEWGCPEVQGFYFARPLPADEVEFLLRKRLIEPRTSGLPPLPAPTGAVVSIS